MSNFTPLTDTNKKKINKFFLIANLFLILLISIVGFVYYNQTLQPTKPGAAQRSCRDINNQKECNASCSPTKSDGKSYACKWLSAQNKCTESGNECGSRFSGSGRCPSWTTASDKFDHCNNCKAYCDCVVYSSGITPPIPTFVDIYYCPNYDHICENQNPTQCKKENNLINTPIPTSTPTPTPTRIVVSNTPTPTPTRMISNTPTPTVTPIPTNTPTTPPNQPTNTPAPTATNTPIPSPTEIILVANTNTPIPSQPTNTPIQQIVQTGDLRSSLVFTLPIGVILLGLLL
jgi:hypothetical protein